MTMFRSFRSILFLHVALTLAMVHAQDDQSGFISIDCGIKPGTNYTDEKTGIKYVSEAGFIDVGVSGEILSQYKTNTLDFQLNTLTSFPQNTRNCYTLRPQQGKGNRYLIRARFTYGNYDLKGNPPQFDLFLGSDHWYTVNFSVSSQTDYEILHLASSDYIHVCLVNIGLGRPFISALELRLLDSTMYSNQLESLVLKLRNNFGTDETLRYTDDKYDRIWYPFDSFGTKDVQTSDTVSLGPSTKEKVPSKVMSTAVTITIPTYSLEYSWPAIDASEKFFMYIYLAEIETLKTNQTRQFNIYLNDNYWDGPVSPLDHTTTTLFSSFFNSSTYTLRMNKTQISTLAPIFNAIELYTPKQLLQRQTEDQDVAAILSTKLAYRLQRNWQGDPCVLEASVWDGLNCSYTDTRTPRIISLNLSSSGLGGEIDVSLANLTMIQVLDLSYNNMTGSVPLFLSSLDFLKILNLTGNNLTRPLPAELLTKSKKGSLLLSIEGIDEQDTGSKHNKVVIPVTATIFAFFVLLIILAVIWRSKRKRTQDQKKKDEFIDPRNQHFTFSEIKRITDNFSNVIGKGGFGTVFRGFIGDTQIAVKILSESSTQGYKEFHTEVRLLMSVHHKNITSLVGYCNEGGHKGIIYEYMANGNLGTHLFDGSPNVLSWKQRLQIGYDAAQGLEYMHHGCKPPIVHRDVKCTNILLNEKFQVKLADFGLSRAFTNEAFIWRSKRKRTQDQKKKDEFIDPRNQHFTFSEIKRITDNFSNVIGKGGFGTVFRGFIGDTQIAVKILSESSTQGYKEFHTEVRLLMSVHHKNITSLVGYCNEGGHKGIIYEYMANGNLGTHLFDGSPNVLSWKQRLQIGYDAAQGLEYMHHGCKPPIVPRDVKCTNILLNEKFQVKLADFGLSRAFTNEGATHISTGIAYTPGYLDPEDYLLGIEEETGISIVTMTGDDNQYWYYQTNRLTAKSDVYSFGVVLLELITSRPATKDIYIVKWVKSMVEEGNVENIIDPRLQGDFDINSAWKVVELAMNCVDHTSVERPTMNDVVIDL